MVKLVDCLMRYQINDKSGNRLGVMDLEVSAIDMALEVQRRWCVRGHRDPDVMRGAVSEARMEVGGGETSKRRKRGSEKLPFARFLQHMPAVR